LKTLYQHHQATQHITKLHVSTTTTIRVINSMHSSFKISTGNHVIFSKESSCHLYRWTSSLSQFLSVIHINFRFKYTALILSIYIYIYDPIKAKDISTGLHYFIRSLLKNDIRNSGILLLPLFTCHICSDKVLYYITRWTSKAGHIMDSIFRISCISLILVRCNYSLTTSLFVILDLHTYVSIQT
jgi:hypothetical protein